MRLLTVDPGLEFGYACWEDGDPIHVGVLRPPKDLSWQIRVRVGVSMLMGQAFKHKIDRVACEWPRVWDSAGSIMAAKRGDLLKLAFWVGSAHEALLQEARISQFMLVPVEQWKGNMSKARTEKWIRRHIPARTLAVLKPTTHAWDALGIGLWWWKTQPQGSLQD